MFVLIPMQNVVPLFISASQSFAAAPGRGNEAMLSSLTYPHSSLIMPSKGRRLKVKVTKTINRLYIIYQPPCYTCVCIFSTFALQLTCLPHLHLYTFRSKVPHLYTFKSKFCTRKIDVVFLCEFLYCASIFIL